VTVRVVMYVQNDATHDSRVLREAGTLAAAGHGVTVMATTRARDAADRVDPPSFRRQNASDLVGKKAAGQVGDAPSPEHADGAGSEDSEECSAT